MTPEALLAPATHALWIAVLAIAPLVIPALVAGLIMGVIQAATSVNEAALGFLPKLAAVCICLVLFGAAITALLTDFFAQTFTLMAEAGR